jgi:hypothetical protein
MISSHELQPGCNGNCGYLLLHVSKAIYWLYWANATTASSKPFKSPQIKFDAHFQKGPRFEPGTFWTWGEHATNWATPPLLVLQLQLDHFYRSGCNLIETRGYTTVSFADWYRKIQPVNNLSSIFVAFWVAVHVMQQAYPLKSSIKLLAHVHQRCGLYQELWIVVIYCHVSCRNDLDIFHPRTFLDNSTCKHGPMLSTFTDVIS